MVYWMQKYTDEETKTVTSVKKRKFDAEVGGGLTT